MKASAEHIFPEAVPQAPERSPGNSAAQAPELLSPAGSMDALRAAVQNGADAVYLGYGSFHARVRASGFSDEDFRAALRYCHLYGVRVYLTLNTLLTDREIPAALEQARVASRLGVDAVLVQDWGLLSLLRACLPDLPVHASTQMSVFTSGGVQLLRDAGCTRIVAARECSRDDIAALCRNGAEIETFVHGALCMCCSGQCEMSALIGGRSGNRGRCAQPCRLPCSVGVFRPDVYALSLKDLNMSAHLEELRQLGVACLKIEGRLKRPEYVAAVTAVYSRLLRERRGPSAEEADLLQRVFSRSGFTDAYWTATPGPHMFGTRRDADSGPIPRDAGFIQTRRNTDFVQTFRNADSVQTRRNADSSPAHRDLSRRSEPVTKTAAPDTEELFRTLRATYERDDTRKIKVNFTCSIRSGTETRLTVRDPEGRRATVTGPVPEAARTRALTPESVAERLAKTGGTPYAADTIRADVADGLSLPVSALNALRRDALEALSELRVAPPARREFPMPPPPAMTPRPSESVSAPRYADTAHAPRSTGTTAAPRYTVSVFRPAQLIPDLLTLDPERIYLPLEWFADGFTVPDWLRAAGNVELCAIPPRVWRDRDEPALAGMFRRAVSQGLTGALAGNIGHLPLLSRAADALRVYGDFGLNVTNARSAAWLGTRGLRSVCVSFELRTEQIRDMTKPLPVEAILYGRLPLMITENYPGGTRPNKNMEAVLTDRTGAVFPLLDAFGDRTEIQNSRPVWLADRDAWRGIGLSLARLRFTTESPAECADAVRGYLERRAPQGPFTRGLYERGVE